MTRIQVLISESQNEKLAHLAGRLKTTKSTLIREAVDMILKMKTSKSSGPLMDLIGQAGEALEPDISIHHDDFLAKHERKRWTEKESL